MQREEQLCYPKFVAVNCQRIWEDLDLPLGYIWSLILKQSLFFFSL